MKPTHLFIAFIFNPVLLLAQNLVPNPSLETYIDLPTYMFNGVIDDWAPPWFVPPTDQNTSGGTSPNYINTQMPLTLYFDDTYDFIEANSGYGYAQFGTAYYNQPPQSTLNYFHENIEIRLKEPMEVGEHYIVSYYAHFAPLACYEAGCHFANDELGLYLHTDSIYNSAFVRDVTDSVDNAIVLYVEDTVNAYGFNVFLDYAVEPHISLDTLLTEEMGWYLIKDTIYADKPYEFMYWGQFRPTYEIQWQVIPGCGWSSKYSVVYVDDVSVHLLDEEHLEADAGVGATICNGDSIQIGTSDNEDYMYWWSPNEEIETSDFGGVNPGMPWVKPTETTTYTLTQKDFGFIESTDEVTITVEFCPGFSVAETVEEPIKIFPNPAKNFIEIESLEVVGSWKLLDATGKEVASSKYLVSSKNFLLDVSGLDVGLYFLEIEIDGVKEVKQLVVE